jgi:hypothetical protein
MDLRGRWIWKTVSIVRAGAEACNGAGLGPERHRLLVSSGYNFKMLQYCAG